MKNINVCLVFLITSFLLFSNSIFADTKTDSLYQIVQKTSEDSLKIAAFIHFLYEINSEYHPDLEVYADEFLEYAQLQNSVRGIAHAYKYKGFAQFNKLNYIEAIRNQKISLENFLEIKEFKEATDVQKSIFIDTRYLADIEQLEKEFEKYENLVEKIDDNFYRGDLYVIKAENAARNGEMTKMQEFSEKAIEMYASYGDKYVFNKAIVLANMSNSLLDDKPVLALEYLEEARAIAETIDIPDFLGYVIGLQGMASQSLGDYEKAITLAFEEIALFDSLQRPKQMAEAKISLGILYVELSEVEGAKNAFKEAIVLSEKASFHRGEISANGETGHLFLGQKDYEEAIFYYEKASALADSVQENGLKLELQASLATAHIKLGQAEKAYQILIKALEGNKHESEAVDEDIYLGLANYFLVKENWKEAIKYAQKSYQISKRNESKRVISEIASILYKSNKELKRYPTALEWLEIQKKEEARVLNESNIRKLTAANLNADFNQEKKILAAEQEKQEILLEAKAERNLLVALTISALALLALGFFLNARRNNKKIAAQNAEISNKNSQLQQVNQTKDRIFAIIGHDLRKPVVAFSGISETINYLIKKEDYATLQQLGGEIEKDGFALQKLTDNLLNWALTQRDVMPYNPQEIKLADKAEEILLIFEKVARDKNIDLINKVPQGLNVFVDSNSLLTILINLVDNALKYTPNGGQVEINAVTDTKGTRLEVTDTGVGIPKGQLKDIFLLQKDKSQKGTGGEKGTGLGLHLVNELVKLNHGEIAAENREGKGTIFRVLLPTEKLKTA